MAAGDTLRIADLTDNDIMEILSDKDSDNTKMVLKIKYKNNSSSQTLHTELFGDVCEFESVSENSNTTCISAMSYCGYL